MTWGECDGREPPIMRITTLKYAELEILQGLQNAIMIKFGGRKGTKNMSIQVALANFTGMICL
jgi:hypothetical protein